MPLAARSIRAPTSCLQNVAWIMALAQRRSCKSIAAEQQGTGTCSLALLCCTDLNGELGDFRPSPSSCRCICWRCSKVDNEVFYRFNRNVRYRYHCNEGYWFNRYSTIFRKYCADDSTYFPPGNIWQCTRTCLFVFFCCCSGREVFSAVITSTKVLLLLFAPI